MTTLGAMQPKGNVLKVYMNMYTYIIKLKSMHDDRGLVKKAKKTEN